MEVVKSLCLMFNIPGKLCQLVQNTLVVVQDDLLGNPVNNVIPSSRPPDKRRTTGLPVNMRVNFGDVYQIGWALEDVNPNALPNIPMFAWYNMCAQATRHEKGLQQVHNSRTIREKLWSPYTLQG